MPIKLSDAKRDELISKLRQDIEASNAYYEQEVEPKVIERYRIYNADKHYYEQMFPSLSKKCSLVSTDVHDTISSVMPSLMKTFFQSSDVISVEGRDGGPDDEQRAKVMQELVNYELEHGSAYMTFYQWMLDSLITNCGIVKCDWERTYKPEEHSDTVDAQNLALFTQQIEGSRGKVESIEPQEADGNVTVHYTLQVIDKNRPRIRNVLASEFRFDPTATSLHDCAFVAHRKVVSIDHLRKQAETGLYDMHAVEELAVNGTDPHYTALDTYNNMHIDEDGNEVDTGRRKVELYECYVDINVTDNPNAVLEPYIITISGDQILRIEKNTYERAPFFLLTASPEPHKIWPDKGYVDTIAPIQHSKTAILRQMIYNLAQSNDSKMAVDLTQILDPNDLINNNRYIRVNGNVSEAIQPLPAAPVQPWSMNMLQYLDDAKQEMSGVTKYNQGMDSSSLNKTATGIQTLTQQSNMRLELIARTFAETGISELFRYLIKLNQLFVNQPMVIRLANQPLTITPDDLDGSYDLVINAGMGASSHQEHLQALQMLVPLVQQLAQIGMTGPEQFYNLFTKICNELGYKDADQFIMNPQQSQQYLQQQQAQQQQPQAQPPKVSVGYDQLPWQAQMQLLNSMGLQATPQMMTEKVRQDALQNAVNEHTKADANRAPEHGAPDAAQALAFMSNGNPQEEQYNG